MSGIDWTSFLVSQLWSIPFLIVYVVGIVLSLVFWRRHPAVSILCLIAFCILIGGVVIGGGIQFWQMGALQRGSSYQDIARVLSIVGVIRSVFSMIAWILLLTALFGWRTAPASMQKGT